VDGGRSVPGAVRAAEGIAQRRAELEEKIKEAEIELNDLNMVRGMRY